MDDWRTMAQDSFDAASELMETERWRSLLSRAYYAAYARCVHVLQTEGIRMPARGNPAHGRLPELVGTHMTRFSDVRRFGLVHAIEELYRYRLIADYLPSVRCGREDARMALGLTSQVFREMKREYS